MQGTTHLTFGLGLGLALGILFEAPYDVCTVDIIGVSLGALFPDIDSEGLIAHPGELLSVKNKNIRTALNSLGSGLSKTITKFAKHRGFFHWPFNALLFIFYGMFFGSPFAFYFGMGYLSHCFLDSFNNQGIPIFAPFDLKKYHIASIKYGGFGEKIFLISFALLIILFMKNDLINYFNIAMQK